MKGLLYRDLCLSKKNWLTILGLSVGTIIWNLLVQLSFVCGNLKDFMADVYRSVFFADHDGNSTDIPFRFRLEICDIPENVSGYGGTMGRKSVSSEIDIYAHLTDFIYSQRLADGTYQRENIRNL